MSSPLPTGLARRTFYLASVAVVVWASAIVPLPFVEYVPGEPTEVRPLIEIDGVEIGELSGETSMLTVVLRQQPTLSALRALVDDRRELHRVDHVYPPGIERDEYLHAQRDRFSRQFEIAAAVGARAAGTETELVTEVVVVDVVPGSAADGVLRTGDAVIAVDGEPIVAAEELQAAVRSAGVGARLRLEVRGVAGDVEVRTVRVGQVPGEDGPRIGVAIHTAVDELRLPFDIRLAEGTRIGGPSAGLVVGLTVYDLLADEDLLAGRRVAGTGTLDADGSVGPVGGVPEKMRAAARTDPDVVLVPRTQLDEARRAEPGLAIVGVASLDDAIAALRGDPA